MSGLYVVGGALVGAAITRMPIGDVLCFWTMIFGLALVAAGAAVEATGGRS